MKKIRFGIFGSGYMGQTHTEAILKLENAIAVAVAGGSRAPGYRCGGGDNAALPARARGAALDGSRQACASREADYHVDRGLRPAHRRGSTRQSSSFGRLSAALPHQQCTRTPHAIDLLRWFTGAEVATVSSFSRTFRPKQPVEDTTMALMEFSNGMLCSLFSSCALPAPIFPHEDFRIRIMGSRGLLDLDPYRELRMADAGGWRVMNMQPEVGYDDASTVFGDARMQAYRDQITTFLDVIPGKAPVGGTPADGRAGVETCLAMLASSREQRWIQLRNS